MSRAERLSSAIKKLIDESVAYSHRSPDDSCAGMGLVSAESELDAACRQMACGHKEHEDCMICCLCGDCKESLDDAEICADCRE